MALLFFGRRQELASRAWSIRMGRLTPDELPRMTTFKLGGLDIGVFLAYMAAVLAVGYWAARRGKQTKRDYFLSGDKLPWWMIGGSIVASNISSHHLVGVLGMAYSVASRRSSSSGGPF